LGIQFIVLSPVNFTNSHPNSTPLGWEKFSGLCQQANMPVYALGGMKKTDYQQTIESGAQGIAAISGLWISG